MRLKAQSFSGSYRPNIRSNRPCTAKPIMSLDKRVAINKQYKEVEEQTLTDCKSINIVTTDRSIKQFNSNTGNNNYSQNYLRNSDYIIPEIEDEDLHEFVNYDGQIENPNLKGSQKQFAYTNDQTFLDNKIN